MWIHFLHIIKGKNGSDMIRVIHKKLYESQIGTEKNKSLVTVLGVSKLICKEDGIIHVSYQRIPVDYLPLDSLKKLLFNRQGY